MPDRSELPTENDREFPEALLAVAKVNFDCGAGDADYEPHDRFLTDEETTSWIRAWTGNQDLDGDGFRVIGEDGTGGYAAFCFNVGYARAMLQACLNPA